MAGDANFASVVLLVHGDGPNNSTAIRDSSGTPKTLSAVAGAATISTTQSKFGGSALSFAGGVDRVTFADHVAFAIGTGDFTIEAWIHTTNTGVTRVIASQWTASSGADSAFIMFVDGTNLLHFVPAAGTDFSSAATVPLSQWVHVAVTRSAGLVRLFINGALDANTLTFASSIVDSTQPMAVGGYQGGGTGLWQDAFNGYIDEFRFTNGVARYTASFTPPVAPFADGAGQVTGSVMDAAGAAAARWLRVYRRDSGALLKEMYTNAADANYDKVSLLLRGRGVDGATTIPDASPIQLPMTAAGNARISNAAAKFDLTSMFFDGSGDLLTTPHHTGLNLATGDFTIEAWVKYTALSAGNMQIFNKDGTSSFLPSWAMSISSAGKLNGVVGVSSGAASANVLTGATSLTAGVFNHVAFTRQGTTLRVFVNGVLDGTITQTITPVDSARALALGGLSSGTPATDYLHGYVQEARVTKGLARYTASFTPPTEIFSDRVAGALGTFGIAVPSTDEVMLICLDAAVTGTIYNDLVERVIPA